MTGILRLAILFMIIALGVAGCSALMYDWVREGMPQTSQSERMHPPTDPFRS